MYTLKTKSSYKKGCQGSRYIWGHKTAEGSYNGVHTNRRKQGGVKEKTGRNTLYKYI